MRSLCGEKEKIVTLVLPVNPPTLALITAATRHLYSARASFAVMSHVSRLATKLRRSEWICAPLQILINITPL